MQLVKLESGPGLRATFARLAAERLGLPTEAGTSAFPVHQLCSGLCLA